MVSIKLYNYNDDTTTSMTWSSINPISGTTDPTGNSWKYSVVYYTSSLNKFKIRLTNTDSDTKYYVALQAAGGLGGTTDVGEAYAPSGTLLGYKEPSSGDGEDQDDSGAGGGGGGQLFAYGFQGGSDFNIKVTLRNIGDSTGYSTLQPDLENNGMDDSDEVVYIGNGKDGSDGRSNSSTDRTWNGANGANGGDGGDKSSSDKGDNNAVPFGTIYGGGGGNRSEPYYDTDGRSLAYANYNYQTYVAGDPGEKGTGRYNASDGGTATGTPGYYTFSFADGTSVATCKGGKSGDATRVWYGSGTEDWYTTYVFPKSGNTPWFLIYYKT